MNLILFEPGAFVLSSNDERYRHLKEILKKGEGDTFAAGIVNGMKGTASIESMAFAVLNRKPNRRRCLI